MQAAKSNLTRGSCLHFFPRMLGCSTFLLIYLCTQFEKCTASDLIVSDIFLCFPKWCSSKRLVGVMLNKPGFVAPHQIGFVHKSNLISFQTYDIQFGPTESNRFNNQHL